MRPEVVKPDRRRAAFLDRDGVLNIDRGYVFDPAELMFTPTALEAVGLLNQLDYVVLIVSNQSGIARGYYTHTDVVAFNTAIQDRLRSGGAWIDAFYYSPYHPDGIVTEFAVDHEDRKPRPGMLLRAIRDWSISVEDSFLIGDKSTDIDAANCLGIAASLVETNRCDLLAEVKRLVAR